ncbi:MAG: ATP-binding protein [Nitrospirae bacterium]|nr:ATP-binding protein [Nitrospirota bacterium]
MTVKEFYEALQMASNTSEVEKAIGDFEVAHKSYAKWVPLGGRDNNRGPIEISTDPGRSLVERITNSIDAVLESEHERHSGRPDCRSPKEAAIAWLNVPEKGLSDLTQQQRRILAQKVSIKLLAGDGPEARTVEVRDNGIGIIPGKMPQTILSINESNKVQKHYVVGVYGQGGSSTFAMCKYTFIASRFDNHATVGFTVVYYLDLPPEEYKTGHYVYLTINDSVLNLELSQNDFPAGTLVKHFGYDLSGYKSPVGPGSIYGLLQSVLFDPVLPVWLDYQFGVRRYGRVIKGSRNALNGAIDEGDDKSRGPELSHNVPMFYVSLGDFGRIGIEYWLLQPPDKDNKNPIAAFVNPKKPLILTLNGQNHAELSKSFIVKDAELPYLGQRLICHVDCNSLTPSAQRALVSSTREAARHGFVLDIIQRELISALKSDDELLRLNNEAKDLSRQVGDETVKQEMRKEVARLLRVYGIDTSEPVGGEATAQSPERDKPTHPRPPKPQPRPVELHEPPTYIKILWKEGRPINFYPEQRRYVRIETDANGVKSKSV